MFTGLVTHVGRIKRVTSRDNYLIVVVDANFGNEPLQLGESISCNGCCLTVVATNDDEFTVEISQETIERTTVSDLAVGSKMNLERAMKLSDRLGGHLVSGHVDCVGKIVKKETNGDSLVLSVGYAPVFNGWVIEKGSIAIDGVSLTVNRVYDGELTVNIIPHTSLHTNMQQLKVGSRVNLEFDMIAKMVARQVALGESARASSTIRGSYA